MKKKIIFNPEEIGESIDRIAREILAQHGSIEDLVIVGIRTGGAYLAVRLQEAIADCSGYYPISG